LIQLKLRRKKNKQNEPAKFVLRKEEFFVDNARLELEVARLPTITTTIKLFKRRSSSTLTKVSLLKA